MIVTLLLIVAPILFYLAHRLKNKRMYELAATVTSANEELPLIGVAHMLIGVTPADLYVLVQKLSYQCIEKGGIIKLWLGPYLYYVTTRAVDVEFLLKTQLAKTSEYDILQGIIGSSTLNAPVPIWKWHRKILMPAFTSKMIDSYFPTFIAKSKKLVEKLDKQADAGDIELFPFISTYELAIVCETTYGVNVNCQDDSNHPFLVQVEIIMAILSDRVFKLWQRFDCIFKLSRQYSTFRQARKTLQDFILMIIRTKREEMRDKRRETSKGNEIDLSASEIPSFLELVLNLEEDAGYTDTELMQELLALTLAGTDTSAVSLCFMFELLAKYPKVQESVYEEIKYVLGDSARPLEKEDLPKLQYMERVIKESLRLYGAAGVIGRKVEQEIKLPSGPTLAAGSGAIISIYGLHRNPEYWGPDAEEFDPDRFLPERLNLAHPCHYLPFSYGPRNCPGFHFGNMTIKIAISDVVRRFKIIAQPEKSATPTIKAKFDLLTKPLHGVRVALKRRN